MPKLSSALNTLLLTQAHAHHWRKDRIKHRKFLFQSLLTLLLTKLLADKIKPYKEPNESTLAT
jgi:hypothetical protein